MRKFTKSLLTALALSGTALAIQVYPVSDGGAYCSIGEECGIEQPSQPVEQKPAPKQETTKPQPVKPQPIKTIVEKKEQTFIDWGEFKKHSPEQLLQEIRTLLNSAPQAVSYPKNAPVGCCYGKLVKPPTFKKIVIKYIKKDAEIIKKVEPAKFRIVEKKILVRPAYHTIEVIPAKYETKQEKILLHPATSVWSFKNGIYCKVQQPAEYITITRQVLVEGPRCVSKLVPAEYKIIKVKELVKDATCKEIRKPPVYGTITKTVQIKGPEVMWDAVLCDVNMKPEDVKAVQAKLSELGYYKGTLTGQLDDATMAALVKFQVDHNLPAGNLSIETLEALGLKNIAQNYLKCELKNIK